MAKELFDFVQEQRGELLSNKVADRINQLIIDRNFKPGDRIPNEFELIKELNVGRGTIREAIKLLVARNCLVIRRGVGTFVAERTGQVEDPLGFNYVEDKITLAKNLLEIRLRLEPWIAALAAERITQEEKEELVRQCDLLEEEVLSGRDHGEKDKAFHTYLAKCTHNNVMPELIPIITHSVQFFTRLREPELLEGTVRTHREITDAVCRNDVAAAEEAMRRHLRINEKSIEKAIGG